MPWFARLAAVAFACVLAGAAAAAQFPVRTIEWVVPYPPGGGSDIVARTLAERMTHSLGQPVVVVNKPGAATAIGAAYVARAEPTGYVMVTGDTATLAANPALYRDLAYDPAKDFAPVGMMARFSLVLAVHPGVPARDYRGFVDWVRAQPNGVDYASPGTGSPHHLAGELFRRRSGLELQHVPYRGAAPALQDVVAGQVPVAFVDSAAGHRHLVAGRLRPIAVASAERLPGLPDTPTLHELGLDGFEAHAWQGLLVPGGTPPEVIERLSAALRAALAESEVRRSFATLGLQPLPGPPQAMRAHAAQERERWARLIREHRIVPQ